MRVKYSKNTKVIVFRADKSKSAAIDRNRPSYHVSHFVCTTMDSINTNGTPALAPANAAMSPDSAGGDGSSALFLALQNPSLSKAASVLLRSMQETGSISGEDAALMSAFLSSCDVPQPDDFVGEGIGGASGGSKRARDIAQSAISDLGGDDEIRAAAAARTVTAQIPDSEWEPNPINKKPKSTSQSPVPGFESQSNGSIIAVPADVSENGTNAELAPLPGNMQSVRSEYTHEKRLSDPGSCAPCRRLGNPLNLVPIKGRESHTSDLDAFDRYVDVLRHARRPPTIGPYSEEFWSHIRGILEAAVPVGFEELPDKDAVVPKGPADCAKFLGKVVATASINPIHPNIVAEAAKLPLGTVLNELFCATRLGLVDMHWAPLCERCGSMACAKSRIEDLPGSTYCGGCQYENTVDCLEKIKVIFTLNRDVYYVLMENFACTPSKASMGATCMFAVIPATSTGSGFRYSVGCGGDLQFCPALEPGRYRMHCPVAKTDNYLFVQREAAEEDKPCQVKLAVSDMVVRPGDQLKTFYATHGKLHFDIFPDTRSFLVLWIQKDLDEHTLKYLPAEERPDFTSAKQIIEFPTFQVLFQKEVEAMLLTAMQKMKQKNAD